MDAHVDPGRGDAARVPAVWTPSAREVERAAARRRIARRNALVAASSSAVVLGAMAAAILLSPGYTVVATTFFDPSYGREVLGTVAKGLITNVTLTLVGSVVILFLGLLIALARTTTSASLTPLRILATVYVDIFRGVPLLLVILLVGFGVPALRLQGMTKSVLVLGTAAVVLTYTAYVAEVLRSGILSVHPSQRAAARSLGLTAGQTMRHVVLPQAVRRVVPPLLNDLVALLKDSGLVSILGVIDAVRAAQIEASSTFNYTPYVTASLLFLLITVPLTRYTDRVLIRSLQRQNAQGTT